ncbi:MAG: alpha-D-glucose phosphate-specific phosphoglucomutase [Candidatus Tokpelaia sp.]|uniref:alpha-D-glucose phosphate-specific phosphoglucomutase n=1 Tax=Candidatus Tokpelaia sp. TaxID=2233777 RepID=UPI0012391147|nr:alpha-D-glucose phosphate-specific phosphoglucomutase [Candidatus Tokpelaia sp.]KAA6205411.1 MAG: alpha-D-glucose phosphate-specific phosphoglucomutase [Candidatus Tokpelaia sp.]KAA6406193.1 alpha-D-glucose phosphate-specific phosphoglucomutase [Candidatus Tokpelaia sp.]
MQIKTVTTTPFDDQNPGTSGLRKKVALFARPHYAENFIQAVFNAVGPMQGKLLVLGGDGRYYNREIIQLVLKMAVAQNVGKILLGQSGILSTPATSHIIRKYQAYGGFILSASHNCGGVDGDFGIKYNMDNGGPAPEKVTQAIFTESKKLTAYHIAVMDDVNIDRQGRSQCGETIIEVIDSVRDYADMMEDLFDFAVLRRFCAQGFAAGVKNGAAAKANGAGKGEAAGGFRFCFDAMNAVTGPYAHEIFEHRLGLPKGTVIRGTPLPDFGKIHPDPNRIYAADLCRAVMAPDGPDFGAASDGDGDRNLIIGKGMFVAPSDSLAILAANATLVKAYKTGLRGIARSMPTGMAADRVAARLGLPLFETPTGWKFFGNLLDSGAVTFCGEESFGTGSSHVREKDGIWAVLMWLNIMAATGKTVKQLVEEHWALYGRNYYTRYDYEGVESNAADKIMADLRAGLAAYEGQEMDGWEIVKADDFAYHDPVDKSVSRHQGIRFLLAKAGDNAKGEKGQKSGREAVKGDKDANYAARFVFRLSGTGTQGATLRLYLEYYEADYDRQNRDVQEVLAPLARLADKISGLQARLQRNRPSMIV